MSLLEQLQDEVKSAMKARDSERLGALRLLVNALKNQEKEQRRPLTDEEALDIMVREAKRRRESIEAYEKAARQDLVDAERFELSVIETYLPQQLTPEAVAAIVAEIVAECGATSKKDIGLVMKSLMPRIKGRFPGNAVRPLVDAALGD